MAKDRIIERVVLEGVVYEFHGDEVEVRIDEGGEDVTRIMDANELRRVAIVDEGQAFYILLNRYKSGKTEKIVYPCGNPLEMALKDVTTGEVLERWKKDGKSF